MRYKLMNEFGYKHRENDIAVSILEEPNTKNKTFLKDDNIYLNNEILFNKNLEMNLKGMHNINNIMFIFAACNILGLDFDKVVESIKTFKPLEHRMEFVAKVNGVDYYNDSIATIPASTINAVNALKNVNTILVGGNDRGVYGGKSRKKKVGKKVLPELCGRGEAFYLTSPGRYATIF